MTALILIIFIVSLPVSVMFSGAEMAIGSISRDSLEKLAESKVRGASLILGMIENKRRFLLMLLYGKILSIIVGTVFLYTFFFMKSSMWGLTNSFSILLTIVVSVSAYTLTEGLFSKLISTGEYENRVPRFAIFLYFLVVFNILLLPFTFSLIMFYQFLSRKNQNWLKKKKH